MSMIPADCTSGRRSRTLQSQATVTWVRRVLRVYIGYMWMMDGEARRMTAQATGGVVRGNGSNPAQIEVSCFIQFNESSPLTNPTTFPHVNRADVIGNRVAKGKNRAADDQGWVEHRPVMATCVHGEKRPRMAAWMG